MPLRFNLVEICALVDTGASRSFVSRNAIQDLREFMYACDDNESLSVVLPNGE